MNHHRSSLWSLLFLSLFLFISTSHAEPLPAAEVFQISAQKIDPNTLKINWVIKPGYFLYRDRIQVLTSNNTNVHLAPLHLPTASHKTDKQGQTYAIYRSSLALPVNILGEAPGETLLSVRYQGCSDDGFCYPPEKRELKVSIDSALALSDVSIEAPQITSQETTTTPADQRLIKLFCTHHWGMILLIFYGFGLLLSFTPCILPMVPVLSGIIVGHGTEVTTRKAFFLSLSYVLSMSVTYAAVGAIVALVGNNLQVSMQSPWTIALFSTLFVLLALSMFGFYEFKLPDAWQQKISGSSRQQRGGHYLGAAIMGCLSTLILSPCVTAPLLGVLGYIAQTQDILMGSITLFVLSLGMGTPLLLIGTSAGKLLPKAGSWMNTIKAFFGVMLLAVAIYLLERIIPSSLSMFLWAYLLIGTGIYTGALTQATSPKEKGFQTIGIVFLFYGLLVLVGSSIGSDNPLQPLSALKNAAEPQHTLLSKQNITSIEKAIQQANGTPVILDFYADWCASCKVIEASILHDHTIQAALNQVQIIKIDISEDNADNKALMKHFQVIAPPVFLFFNKKGHEIKSLRLVGEFDAEELVARIEEIKS